MSCALLKRMGSDNSSPMVAKQMQLGLVAKPLIGRQPMRRSRVAGRRMYSVAVSIGKKRFFNRQDEIGSFDEILRPTSYGEPGKLLMVLGPKDSGKTAVVQEFRRRQEKEGLSGVSAYIDLREPSNNSPDEFARNLWKTLGRSMDEKLEAELDLKLLGKWGFFIEGNSFKLTTPVTKMEYSPGAGIGMSTAFKALEEYCISRMRIVLDGYIRGFPTIFIDEANVLCRWEPKLATELMRLLVRISKQECGANVVLLSSENFFKTWLENSEAFRGHAVLTKTIGNIPKDHAMDFVRSLVMHDEAKLKEVDGIWDDVFEHIGGGPLVLWNFGSVVNKTEAGSVHKAWEAWKRDKIFSALASLKARAFRPIVQVGASATWNQQEFLAIVKALADKPDGAVPYFALADNYGNAVDSLIEHDLLQYRSYSAGGLDRDISGVTEVDYPLVMPASRIEFVAMKKLLEQAN